MDHIFLKSYKTSWQSAPFLNARSRVPDTFQAPNVGYMGGKICLKRPGAWAPGDLLSSCHRQVPSAVDHLPNIETASSKVHHFLCVRVNRDCSRHGCWSSVLAPSGQVATLPTVVLFLHQMVPCPESD